jgi:hypothetical protein
MSIFLTLKILLDIWNALQKHWCQLVHKKGFIRLVARWNIEIGMTKEKSGLINYRKPCLAQSPFKERMGTQSSIESTCLFGQQSTRHIYTQSFENLGGKS